MSRLIETINGRLTTVGYGYWMPGMEYEEFIWVHIVYPPIKGQKRSWLRRMFQTR